MVDCIHLDTRQDHYGDCKTLYVKKCNEARAAHCEFHKTRAEYKASCHKAARRLLSLPKYELAGIKEKYHNVSEFIKVNRFSGVEDEC